MQEELKLVGEDQRNFLAFVESMKSVWQGVGQKHDSVGTPGNNYYGPGGPLSYTMARPDVYSALIQPRSFISSLPIVPSRIINEVTQILTGQTAGTGENPTSVCGDPPSPGRLKFCKVNNPYGQFFIKSNTVEVTGLGLYDAHGVMPIQVRNYSQGNDPLIPDPLRTAGVDFASETALRLYELGTQLQRIMAQIEVDGDSSLAPASTELGWIREYDGLSRQIRDGITDISGVTCPAADSLVVNWGTVVGGEVNGLTFPQLLHDVYYSRQQLARKVGMQGTVWAWVMDERLFRQVAFLFACTYAYARCGDATDANPIGRSAAELERRFVEMQNGQYLLIAGIPVPVMFTSGAELDDSTSPIEGGRVFLVPMGWNGAPLTYLPYAPLTPDMQQWNALGNTTARFTTNGGLYHMAMRSNGFCDELLATGRLRMQVDAPFLAARIDDIDFNSYLGYRSFDVNSSSFLNGGVTAYSNVFTPPEV